MSTVLIAVIMLSLAIALILLGVHIGVVLLSTSILGMWFIMDDFGIAASVLGTGPFYAVFNYNFAVIPLFVLMGLFANASGASSDLYDAGFAWLGRLRGGLGLVTIISNAIFAAVTGVSIASAAVFGKIAVPEMLRFGYSKRFSMGCVAGSSALGMLIPPSLLLIVYGILAGQSIGKLFIAGIIPGILLAGTYSAAVLIMAYFYPRILGKPLRPEKISWTNRFKSLGRASSIGFLIAMVLGGIYAGVFTPTEAGAIGCVGAMIIMLVKGRFNMENLSYSLMETGLTTASVFLLIIGAQMFARMLTVSGVVASLSEYSTTLALPPKLIAACMLIILMLLGTFLDVTSILIVAMPIMLPVAEALHFDLIWFGVMCTISIETGLITPPFGMAVFVVKGAVGDMATVEDIFIGSFPFLLILLLTIAILIFFPSLSTWLPSLM
jgi:tripartite ATP-independent transporter DctM subunit